MAPYARTKGIKMTQVEAQQQANKGVTRERRLFFNVASALPLVIEGAPSGFVLFMARHNKKKTLKQVADRINATHPTLDVSTRWVQAREHFSRGELSGRGDEIIAILEALGYQPTEEWQNFLDYTGNPLWVSPENRRHLVKRATQLEMGAGTDSTPYPREVKGQNTRRSMQNHWEDIQQQ
jgi:hypothetical protein